MIDEVDTRGGTLPPGKQPPGPSGIAKLVRWLGLAFVGLLAVALLLPALPTRQGPRSRRSACLSNIRQIGLGIEGYLNREGCYPPGTVPNPDLPPERRLGWGFSIMPYIDLAEYLKDKGMDQQVAAGRPWDDPVFADLIEHPPGITHCRTVAGPACYVGIAGLGPDSPTLPVGHRRAGVFGDDRRVTLADLKDGTSTTMMLVESGSLQGSWLAGGRNTVRGLDQARRPYVGAGRQFGGLHGEGALVLMADGSVRHVEDSVDPEVFEAMATIAGGEKASVPRE